MNKSILIISNPCSGKGKGVKVAPKVQKQLISAGYDAELMFTRSAGDAISLAKNAKTFEENEFVTKYCSCMSECLIENVKWSNNMPISLSEEDEKDMAKVDLAWIELEKNCKQECLKNN